MPSKKNPSSRRGPRSADQNPRNQEDARQTAANPAEFEKHTTPVRERMAREIVETSPEDRLKRGR